MAESATVDVPIRPQVSGDFALYADPADGETPVAREIAPVFLDLENERADQASSDDGSTAQEVAKLGLFGAALRAFGRAREGFADESKDDRSR